MIEVLLASLLHAEPVTHCGVVVDMHDTPQALVLVIAPEEGSSARQLALVERVRDVYTPFRAILPAARVCGTGEALLGTTRTPTVHVLRPEDLTVELGSVHTCQTEPCMTEAQAEQYMRGILNFYEGRFNEGPPPEWVRHMNGAQKAMLRAYVTTRPKAATAREGFDWGGLVTALSEGVLLGLQTLPPTTSPLAPQTYISSTGALRLDAVAGDGSVLTLSDGSVWRVDDRDQARASRWFAGQRVAAADLRGDRGVLSRPDRGDAVRVERLR